MASDFPASRMDRGLARSQFNASRDQLVQRLDAVRDLRLKLDVLRRVARQSLYALYRDAVRR